MGLSKPCSLFNLRLRMDSLKQFSINLYHAFTHACVFSEHLTIGQHFQWINWFSILAHLKIQLHA